MGQTPLDLAKGGDERLGVCALMRFWNTLYDNGFTRSE